ncbi:hypothetical protein [Sorangium sp. So ce1389]|uniref:hypothetical protein n=1 Tax=Sorangium sp. So ce1389 TaxID=3133336 RepID=UPI003F61EDD3
MEPAPPLPSALDDLPPRYPGPTGFSADDAPPAPSPDERLRSAPAAVPAPAAEIPGEAVAGAAAFTAQIHAQIAQIHAQWVEQQAEVHRRFLGMRQLALGVLVRAAPGAARASMVCRNTRQRRPPGYPNEA